MRLLIQYPEEFTKPAGRRVNQDDVRRFFQILFHVLDKKGISYTKSTKFRKLPPAKSFDICLSYHVDGYHKQRNIWGIKKGYIPNYMYFDRTGFSGWAEMADSRKLYEESQAVDQQEATEWFYDFSHDYITKGTSKIVQDGAPLKINGPFVFVAGQRPNDVVAALSRIHTIDLMREVAAAYEGTKYKVVIKPHPIEYHRPKNHPTYDKIKRRFKNVVITQASIHNIIPRCSAVYTVNSGVGFEALLHRKRVFTSGKCDYHWPTSILETPLDVQKSVALLDRDIHVDSLIKFVYYMLTQYFVNTDDPSTIERRIEKVLEEFNEV